jgi:Ca-activated chloride channel family protein
MERTQNHYINLKLPRDASEDEIRRAYKEAARRLHPDVNPQPGASDLFIEIQEAYETLSNPQRRANYDADLGLENKSEPTITINTVYSRSKIPALDDSQLFYILLEISATHSTNQRNNIPLNLALVLDRSTSMQGAKMDMVKANAIRILRQMTPGDFISVVTFSDQAEVLIPAVHPIDISRIEARISLLQTGGSTELLNGLNCGLGEIRRHLNPKNINHLILLTDGHTYGDEKDCYQLAEEAADQGIGISGLGLGDKWNDEFLDKLAGISGGSSMYISAPKDLHQYMEEKFSNLVMVCAENLTLEFECDERVKMRYAFRLAPEPGHLPNESPLRMGRVLSNKALHIVFEFLIRGPLEQGKEVSLAKGRLTMEIPSQVVPFERFYIDFKRPIGDNSYYEPPNPTILQAMSQLSLYTLQEKAREEVLNGDIAKATRHLQNLATHLLSKGEMDLAHTVLVEAGQIQDSNRYSSDGDKRIKYGTRGLLLPSGMEDENL